MGQKRVTGYRAMHTQSKRSPSKEAVSKSLQVAIRVLDGWGCTNEQKQSILQMAKSTYHKVMKSPESVRLSGDQVERVSYILNIHQALRITFDNPENVTGFMSMKNNNPYFNGKSPLEIIDKGRFSELYEVYQRVDSLRSGGW